MQFSDIAIGLIVFGVVSAALYSFRRARYAKAFPLHIVVNEDGIRVGPEGSVVLAESNRIRYTLSRGLGLPSVLNFSNDSVPDDEVREYVVASTDSEPHRGLVDAFIGACCMEAKRRLNLPQLAPLQVELVSGFHDINRRQAFLNNVHAQWFRAMGVRLSVVPNASSTGTTL